MYGDQGHLKYFSIFFVLGATVCVACGVEAEETIAVRVPGFERFHSDTPADSDAGGRLLLGELNCTSCHAVNEPGQYHLLPRQAPILDQIGQRARPEHLLQYIADPQKWKPGTSMPNLFGGLEAAERERQVTAIVHFLVSDASLAENAPATAAVQQGEALFHQIGCTACHDPRQDASPRLTTSMPLPDLHPKYSIPGLAGFLRDPLAIRPSGRMPSLNLSDEEARNIASYLLKDLEIDPVIEFSYYEGNWQTVPNFGELEPKLTGRSVNFDVNVGRENDFGIRFEGFVKIAKEAEYTFHLGSDDGSKLFINGDLITASDGIHPVVYSSGKVKLVAGIHDLQVDFFEAGGGQELYVDIEGGGLPRQPLDSFLVPTKEPAQEQQEGFAVDLELVQEGQRLFRSIGCANCHKKGSLRPEPSATKRLAEVRLAGGCLEPVVQQGIPEFSLDDVQRAALVSALRTIREGVVAESTPNKVIQHTLETFNCFACHARGQMGGVEEARNAFFQSNQKEMGDEGRLPPHLTGIGSKLKVDWMRNVFNNGAKDRPYMFTRMPKFGQQNVAQLVEAFREVDGVVAAQKLETKIPERKMKAAGRLMAGDKGYSCIKCHTFKNQQATGIQAMSLTTMTRRLEEDWFQAYMLNPQQFRPGTRMPASWPRGQVLLPQILDGTAATQIHSLWAYLSAGDEAAMPSGLAGSPIELIAEDEPVIYRNFIEGAGPRAIGVGYPQKVNLAFDANDLRLALLWHGGFIDAAKHWKGRGPGFQPPLGDNILSLPEGVSFATLESTGTTAWPTEAAKKLGYKFRGYRLDTKGQPAFGYQVGAVHVSDKVQPVSDGEFTPVRRVFLLTSYKPVENLFYRAAVAAKIESLPAGWFDIDGNWRIRLIGLHGQQPLVRQIGDKMELLVPIRCENGTMEFAQEYAW